MLVSLVVVLHAKECHHFLIVVAISYELVLELGNSLFLLKSKISCMRRYCQSLFNDTLALQRLEHCRTSSTDWIKHKPQFPLEVSFVLHVTNCCHFFKLDPITVVFWQIVQFVWWCCESWIKVDFSHIEHWRINDKFAKLVNRKVLCFE